MKIQLRNSRKAMPCYGGKFVSDGDFSGIHAYWSTVKGGHGCQYCTAIGSADSAWYLRGVCRGACLSSPVASRGKPSFNNWPRSRLFTYRRALSVFWPVRCGIGKLISAQNWIPYDPTQVLFWQALGSALPNTV